MTVEELEDLFKKHEGEFLKFDRVKYPVTLRKDLHAFYMLDGMCSSPKDMVAGAEHDEIYLGVELSELADKVNEDQVIDLIRCGVMMGEYGLYMFA